MIIQRHRLVPGFVGVPRLDRAQDPNDWATLWQAMEGVHDRLIAEALVLEDGGQRIALVAIEAAEPLREAVAKAQGTPRLNVIQGLRMIGAEQIVGVDINPAREEMARKFGMTDFVNPKEVDDVVQHLVEMTGGGVDYSFECIGNVNVMRQALECCHKGWGQSCIIGVAGAGQEISTRPFQLVTGRSWRGTAFGGARGRTDVPKIVDWYMDGKIEIDPMITHTLSLENINDGFDLMHEGKSIRSVVTF